MSEHIAKTAGQSARIGNYDNVEPTVYTSGAHHLYEVDPETGKKKHVSSDEYLKGWGYDPKVRKIEVSSEPVETPIQGAALPAIAEGAASARETIEEMNGQADAGIDRLEQIIPPNENLAIADTERKFQNGQKVRVVTSGENGDKTEDGWEIVDTKGRNTHGEIVYVLKNPDGTDTRDIAESLLENMQLAPTAATAEAPIQTPEPGATLSAVAEGAASAREIGQDMAAQVEALSRRLDEIIPSQTLERRIAEKFDQLEERFNRRFEELNARMQTMESKLSAQRGDTRTYPPSEASTLVAASPAAENGDGRRELGDRIGSSGQVEIRGQNQEGQPFIYRRREDGQWEVSRNGDSASDWFPATEADIARELGFGLSSPAPTEGPPSDRGRAPREPTPEGRPSQEEAGEVDAEAMDAALAELDAALAAMDAGAADYAEARRHIQRARQRVGAVWNNEQPPAGGGGNDGGAPPVAEAAAPVPAGPESANAAQERRSRLRRHGRRVIGALLVAGGLVGAFFLGRHFGYDVIPGPDGKVGPPGEGAKKAAEAAGGFKTQELRYYGDTIWAHGRATLAQAMGGKLPKDWQIWEWARQTMELKGNKENILNSQGHWRSTWEGARHLPVGFQFKISDRITQLIAARG